MTEHEAAPVADPVLAALLDNRQAFLRFVERRVGTREAAEDVLQEAFARAIDKRDTLATRLPESHI